MRGNPELVPYRSKRKQRASNRVSTAKWYTTHKAERAAYMRGYRRRRKKAERATAKARGYAAQARHWTSCGRRTDQGSAAMGRRCRRPLSDRHASSLGLNDPYERVAVLDVQDRCDAEGDGGP